MPGVFDEYIRNAACTWPRHTTRGIRFAEIYSKKDGTLSSSANFICICSLHLASGLQTLKHGSVQNSGGA